MIKHVFQEPVGVHVEKKDPLQSAHIPPRQESLLFVLDPALWLAMPFEFTSPLGVRLVANDFSVSGCLARPTAEARPLLATAARAAFGKLGLTQLKVLASMLGVVCEEKPQREGEKVRCLKKAY